MLASWAMTSKRKGVDGPTLYFWRALTYRSSFCIFMNGLMDCSIVSSAGCREFTIGSLHCFKYCLPAQVFDVGGAPMSAAKADSSSPELIREGTSSSISLVEILTTLLEDALALPLDFLFVTVVHCWFWTMSGCTHIVSPREAGTGMKPFSFWLWGCIDHS